MTGGRITVDDQAVIRALQRLRARVGDLRPALEDMGEYLLRAHDQRFDRQRAPDGSPWAPLSPRYRKRKAKARPRAGILEREGHLRRLAWQVAGEDLLLGTATVYGATHQLGQEKRGQIYFF